MRIPEPPETLGKEPLGTQPTVVPFWTRHLHREVQVFLDLCVLVAAFSLAYLLRFDFQIPIDELHRGLAQLPVVVLLQFLALLITGIYTFIWRYVGMTDILAFVRAAVYSATPILLLRLGLPSPFHTWRVPLSVLVIDTLLAFGGLLAVRVFRRALYERYERGLHRESAADPERVLLIGAGRVGQLAARELNYGSRRGLEVVGFVDDDRAKISNVIHGIKVLGTTAELGEISARVSADQAIITMTKASSETIRRIYAACGRHGIRVRIVPDFQEILQGKVSISRFRDVRIEDLLGRDPVELDHGRVEQLLGGKRVLITGGGGSIGAELCRQVAQFNPLSLLVLERSEGALFDVDRELKRYWPQVRTVPIIGDAGDEERIRQVFAEHRPQVVIHAAAHKHVPMMEENPEEAIKNNVVATDRLACISGESGAEAFILISTDKAVRPTSVMGASKRVAELIIQARDREFPQSRFLAVRFGNVMGSAGSVVPIFRQQIAEGGPVTVTHPEATRYFMTIPEAAQLVLQAAAIGSGGEILVLDMGAPIKIVELAKDMITLSGFQPFTEIPIVYSGLRPGEKLFEELELSSEEVDRTRHDKVFVGRLEAYPEAQVREALNELHHLAREGDGAGIRARLDDFLPEADLASPTGKFELSTPADELLH